MRQPITPVAYLAAESSLSTLVAENVDNNTPDIRRDLVSGGIGLAFAKLLRRRALKNGWVAYADIIQYLLPQDIQALDDHQQTKFASRGVTNLSPQEIIDSLYRISLIRKPKDMGSQEFMERIASIYPVKDGMQEILFLAFRVLNREDRKYFHFIGKPMALHAHPETLQSVVRFSYGVNAGGSVRVILNITTTDVWLEIPWQYSTELCCCIPPTMLKERLMKAIGAKFS